RYFSRDLDQCRSDARLFHSGVAVWTSRCSDCFFVYRSRGTAPNFVLYSRTAWPGKHVGSVGEISAAIAALATYARGDLVDAHDGRRLTPSDSITHLHARWSPYWRCLHHAAQAAARRRGTPARNLARF